MKQSVITLLCMLCIFQAFAQNQSNVNNTNVPIQRIFFNRLSLGDYVSKETIERALEKTSIDVFQVNEPEAEKEYTSPLVSFDGKIWSEILIAAEKDRMTRLTVCKKTPEPNTDLFNEMSQILTGKYGKSQIQKTDTKSGFYQRWSDGHTCLTLSYEYLYSKNIDKWEYFVTVNYTKEDEN